MTSDSSSLSSLYPLASPIHVVTANGTSLPVIGRGTLSTYFSVPSVAHVLKLTTQLMLLVEQAAELDATQTLDEDESGTRRDVESHAQHGEPNNTDKSGNQQQIESN
ncbi:hypothetical protein GUJ93_ZPchr0007g2996 [Zizania palustris]|uniref:Uncharacterized protein n=1 Tax=Zizania palustris TaxID=103762 RepID=A0A8J5T9U9_ZIZPA|nr:hypothetical protein GUJ93_ZPchr0007g2996 [Zizania palustris]